MNSPVAAEGNSRDLRSLELQAGREEQIMKRTLRDAAASLVVAGSAVMLGINAPVLPALVILVGLAVGLAVLATVPEPTRAKIKDRASASAPASKRYDVAA